MSLTVQLTEIALNECATDAVIIPVLKNGHALYDNAVIAEQVKATIEGQNKFKAHCCDTWRTSSVDGFSASHVIFVGLGDAKDITEKSFRRAIASAIRAAANEQLTSISIGITEGWLNQLGNKLSLSQSVQAATEAVILGSYTFTRCKTEATLKDNAPLSTVHISHAGSDTSTATIQTAFSAGHVVATATNSARDMVFDSANHMTPTALKDFAEGIEGLNCTVLNQEDMAKLGMGSFISVAKGSTEPAYLVHLTYTSETPSGKSIALVGKGVTFDSGGLSLKPSKSMELMKLDMAGAAAVLNTMQAVSALAKAGQPIQHTVHGFAALCENMPNGNASKPGDIVTTMLGKTVEINNTDAEGRLILIDTLTYAQQQTNPDAMIDLATLTGAAVAALGETAAAIMGTDDDLMDAIKTAGQGAGENFWPLPMYDDYKETLKSDVADLINAGSKGKAGTASAALFLKEFVDDGRAWAHLDIAGPAYTSGDQPEVPKGATGFAVRTLVSYLQQA
jgi:leucyl aminopeptidase